MDPTTQAKQRVAEAFSRLRAKGLADDSSAIFSARIPGKKAMAVATPQAGSIRTLVVSFEQVLADEPALSVHAVTYRLRDDAGAILTAQPAWGSRLGQLPEPMPAVFDEQARQLGSRVERLTLQGWDLGRDGTKILLRRANAFLLGSGVLVAGYALERAVLNADLLEKCAKAYILARLTGGRIGSIPWLVRTIAGGRLRKDQRRAAEAWARGEAPGRFSTY
jgi:ribulose-5-phosphate 4-epimerase/fuculose-1-phosphate aldolase